MAPLLPETRGGCRTVPVPAVQPPYLSINQGGNKSRRASVNHPAINDDRLALRGNDRFTIVVTLAQVWVGFATCHRLFGTQPLNQRMRNYPTTRGTASWGKRLGRPGMVLADASRRSLTALSARF